MGNLIDNKMTIGESIEILECLLGDVESPYTDEQCKDKEFLEAEYDEAIRMAIKALQRTMYGDTISRQQTISALRALSDDDGYINVPHEVVTDVVRGLPPVKAEHEQTTRSERGESDKLASKMGGTWVDVTCPNCGCEIHVESKIILCKDCKWQKDQDGTSAWLPCRAIKTPEDFYCGRAERGEE